MRSKPKIKHKTSVGNLENPIEKSDTGKTKHSAWLITLSLNMSFQPGDKRIYDYAKVFQQTIDDLMSDENEILSVLNINQRIKNRTFDSSLSEFHVEKDKNIYSIIL